MSVPSSHTFHLREKPEGELDLTVGYGRIASDPCHKPFHAIRLRAGATDIDLFVPDSALKSLAEKLAAAIPGLRAE
jgi:hypothetical protein